MATAWHLMKLCNIHNHNNNKKNTIIVIIVRIINSNIEHHTVVIIQTMILITMTEGLRQPGLRHGGRGRLRAPDRGCRRHGGEATEPNTYNVIMYVYINMGAGLFPHFSF